MTVYLSLGFGFRKKELGRGPRSAPLRDLGRLRGNGNMGPSQSIEVQKDALAILNLNERHNSGRLWETVAFYFKSRAKFRIESATQIYSHLP